MKKNVASQTVGAQMNSATDGSNVTSGTTTVYLTIDGGTQASIGTATHEGQGYWTIGPSQANTNGDHLAFTFVNSSAVTQSVQLYTTFPQTGDNFARLGTPAGASVSADIAALPAATDIVSGGAIDTTGGAIDNVTLVATTTANTDMRGTDSAALASSVAALNDLSAAQVNTQVDTALADIHLDHIFATDYDPASKPGTATALFNELVESDAGVSRFTVNALENGPSGSGSSPATIAAEVWNTTRASHTTAGTFGEHTGDEAMRGTDSAYTGTPPTATENADALLTRDWTSVTGEASRSVLNALRFLRNKWSISGTTLTVTEEDDTTTAWTSSLTADASANPVTSSDPD